MSYCGMVFRLSFKRLAAIRGSRAHQLIDRLQPKLQADDADFEEEEESLWLVRPEAVRQVVMGEPLVTDYPQPYGIAYCHLPSHRQDAR